MEINNTPIQIPSSNPMNKAKYAVMAVVAIAVVGAAGWFFAGANLKTSGTVLGTNTDYQAVFLTNGQVYFGKLTEGSDWMKLTDIYYLQVTQNLQQADTSTAAKNDIQLVKLGSELHAPQDEMHIDRDKILFWENLKDDGKVVQAIHQYKSK